MQFPSLLEFNRFIFGLLKLDLEILMFEKKKKKEILTFVVFVAQ